jgi:hypothetical protein
VGGRFFLNLDLDLEVLGALSRVYRSLALLMCFVGLSTTSPSSLRSFICLDTYIKRRLAIKYASVVHSIFQLYRF